MMSALAAPYFENRVPPLSSGVAVQPSEAVVAGTEVSTSIYPLSRKLTEAPPACTETVAGRFTFVRCSAARCV